MAEFTNAWAPHWETATLGELAERMTSGSRDWKPYYNRGSGVFILTQHVRMRRLDLNDPFHVDPPADDPARARSAVKKDDLLINIVGGVGTVARVDRDLPEHYVCQSVALVRLKDPRLSPFLELYLASPYGGQQYFKNKTYGMGRPHLSFADIKAMPVPLPPLDEQRSVVAAAQTQLSRVASGRGSLVRAETLFDTYRLATVSAVLSGQAVAEPLRDELTNARRVRLGELATVQYGYTAKASTEAVGPRMLRITDIQDDRVDWASVPYCQIAEAEMHKYRLMPGDLLFARIGATTGKSYLVEADVPQAVFASYLIRVRPSAELRADFLSLYFKSADYWAFIARESRGVGRPVVNGRMLKNLEIPLPSLKAQAAAVEAANRRLVSIAQFQAVVNWGATRASSLENSILQRAATGRSVVTPRGRNELHVLTGSQR